MPFDRYGEFNITDYYSSLSLKRHLLLLLRLTVLARIIRRCLSPEE